MKTRSKNRILLLTLCLSAAAHVAIFYFHDKARIVEPKNSQPVRVVLDYSKKTPKKASTGSGKQTRKTETRPFTYKDLFPETKTGSVVANAGKAASGDVYSPERSAKELPSLLAFAKNLQNMLQVPFALKEFNVKGHATARITAQTDGYKIASVTGDPYFRALLYERLTELLQSKANVAELKKREIKQVKISLHWNKFQTNEVKDPEDRLDIAGNSIAIARVDYELNKAFRLLTGSSNSETGQSQVGMNVLAPLFFALDYLTKKKESQDPDLSHLRESPAYAAPIFQH